MCRRDDDGPTRPASPVSRTHGWLYARYVRIGVSFIRIDPRHTRPMPQNGTGMRDEKSRLPHGGLGWLALHSPSPTYRLVESRRRVATSPGGKEPVGKRKRKKKETNEEQTSPLISSSGSRRIRSLLARQSQQHPKVGSGQAYSAAVKAHGSTCRTQTSTGLAARLPWPKTRLLLTPFHLHTNCPLQPLPGLTSLIDGRCLSTPNRRVRQPPAVN
jgi:hypothetical protein